MQSIKSNRVWIGHLLYPLLYKYMVSLCAFCGSLHILWPRCLTQGQLLGGSTIRISWGRSSTSRASANAAAAAAAVPAAFGGLFAGTQAGGYATTPFGAGPFSSEYGTTAAFGTAVPTATSDPYSAYYSALAHNDATGFQVLGCPFLSATLHKPSHLVTVTIHLGASVGACIQV